MLLSLRKLLEYPLNAKEGPAGKIEQYYFDDEKWTIRYLVVDIGRWFDRTKVLISPLSIKEIDDKNLRIETTLTREQLENSPDFDSEKPISRQMEIQFSDYYRWPYYWTGAGVWGTSYTLQGGMEIPHFTLEAESVAREMASMNQFPRDEDQTAAHVDTHLRSTKEVFGYHIEATDGEFGRVDDFLIDDSNWMIRYISIHLRRFLPSKSVLISRDWVQSISWMAKKFRLALLRDEIANSPEFDPNIPVSRGYEEILHRYYGKSKYWDKKPPSAA